MWLARFWRQPVRREHALTADCVKEPGPAVSSSVADAQTMKKCHRCSKPATLHITELREGAVHELHLCDTCAQQYLNNPADSESADSPDAITDKALEGVEGGLEELDHLICPNCGISFREFRSQGRLGCPHDYIAFERELMPLLENIHGATQHVGKYPKRAPHSSQRQFKLIKLRNELKSAVDDEDYERAARLRDDIHKLEAQLSANEPDAPAGAAPEF